MWWTAAVEWSTLLHAATKMLTIPDLKATKIHLILVVVWAERFAVAREKTGLYMAALTFHPKMSISKKAAKTFTLAAT